MRTVESRRIQYTPSVFARSSLLHLSETGRLTALQPHTSARENLGGYLILVVEQGSGTIEAGRKKYALAAGDVAFVDCSRPYSHSTTADDLWTISWVHFDGPMLSSIYSKFLQRSGKPVFQAAEPASYLMLLSELYDTAEGSSYVRDMSINTRLSSLLEKVMLDCWSEEKKELISERIAVDLDAVKAYIETHYAEPLTLADLSKHFYSEKTYLSRAFKTRFGINMFEYLSIIRINKVKELLRFGLDGRALTISEISELTGYSSEAYLSLRFKKAEGCSPSEYRNRWR